LKHRVFRVFSLLTGQFLACFRVKLAGMRREKKNQHYVPASYLGAWCDPAAPGKQKYVWRFERKSRVGKRKGPHNIFAETDFYTRFRRDGQRDLGLENALGKIETQFVHVRDKVLNKIEWPGKEDLAYLMVSAMLLSFRTKAQRDFDREQWQGMKEKGDLLLAWAKRASPEELRTTGPHFRSDPNVPSMSHEEVVRIAESPIQELLIPKLEVNTPIFLSMDAAIIITKDSLGFVTSDNPCVVIDPTSFRKPPMFRMPSLLSKNVEVTLPISPCMALYLHRAGLTGFLPCDPSLLDEINWRTRYYSYEHFVVRRNEVRECWFEKRPIPEDAWESVQARKRAEAPAES
jgi:Protein of unknown function (DUF4238)